MIARAIGTVIAWAIVGAVGLMLALLAAWLLLGMAGIVLDSWEGLA